MTTYHAEHALIGDSIVPSVRITIDGATIAAVERGARQAGDEAINGIALPGMANVHSHSFQRAMAGLAEWDAGGRDNFWSWREAMYRFAQRLDPDSQHAVARFLFVEMLKAGYTAVGEFHYLHNQSGGAPYSNAGAMAEAIALAASESGIALTMLPTLYVTAGANGQALNDRQKRFGKTVEQLLKLRAGLKGKPGVTALGLALHSLRAVPAALMKEAIAGVEADVPLHIHAAEQVGEVDECVRFLGARPVEFLLREFNISERWCLVHSTHLTAEETGGLAKSGAIAGLCPTTEANLGDGIFPLPDYLDADGRIAIGGDSHIAVDPAEELKALEYSQRLALRRRNVASSKAAPHTAARLWADAARNGARALGLNAGEIAAGKRADIAVVDTDHVSLAAFDGPYAFDAYLFVTSKTAMRDVMVAGNWRVKAGRHVDDEIASRAYRDTLTAMLAS